MKEKQICVYGTSWCGDTARAKQVLKGLGIPFDWFDVDEDAKARKFVVEINKGNCSVPTIVFPDGSILVEPSNTELERKCTQKS